MSLLDTDLIIERRLANGMSPIALARALGVSTMAIRGLEHGTNHDSLTLHRTKLLADALGVPIADLFTREHRADDAALASEEVKAEAALALLDKRIYPEDYAAALGSTLKDAHATFKALQERRAGTGLRVYYSSGRWGLSPNRTMLTKNEIKALEQACMKRTRITISEATLFKEAIDAHASGWPGKVTEAQRPTMARFLRLGWIEKRNERYFPTEEVTLSLGIPSTPHQRPTASQRRSKRPIRRPATAPGHGKDDNNTAAQTSEVQ